MEDLREEKDWHNLSLLFSFVRFIGHNQCQGAFWQSPNLCQSECLLPNKPQKWQTDKWQLTFMWQSIKFESTHTIFILLPPPRRLCADVWHVTDSREDPHSFIAAESCRNTTVESPVTAHLTCHLEAGESTTQSLNQLNQLGLSKWKMWN